MVAACSSLVHAEGSGDRAGSKVCACRAQQQEHRPVGLTVRPLVRSCGFVMTVKCSVQLDTVCSSAHPFGMYANPSVMDVVCLRARYVGVCTSQYREHSVNSVCGWQCGALLSDVISAGIVTPARHLRKVHAGCSRARFCMKCTSQLREHSVNSVVVWFCMGLSGSATARAQASRNDSVFRVGCHESFVVCYGR